MSRDPGATRKPDDTPVEVAPQGDPDDAAGPVPRPTRIPRWFQVAGPPEGDWPVVRGRCHRAASPVVVDGRLDDAAWSIAEWSAPFTAIETGDAVPLESRVAMLWDEEHLYAGFSFEDPEPRAMATEHHSWVFLTDPDAELFVAGPHRYFECGLNPIGTVYEVLWTWIEQLVERRDHAEVDRLFRIPNGLYLTARPGERAGRLGDLDWEVPGARYAAAMGDISLPGCAAVRGWSAEIALPWSGLGEVLGTGGAPEPGTKLRVQAYRAHHDDRDPARNAAMAEAWGPGATPFSGWTWSPQGNRNVHNPERWVELTLVGPSDHGPRR